MAFEGFLLAVFGLGYFISALISIGFWVSILMQALTGGLTYSSFDGLGVPLVCTVFFITGTIALMVQEADRRKTKGRECDVTNLEGIPDFEREQRLHLTLDVKNRVILMDGRKAKDVPSKHQKYTITEHLKDTQVRLRFQQITQLSYIYWEGDISRWEPGAMGFSAPLMGGVRMYARGSSGYAYTEKLKVDYALEIRYRDQAGSLARIVLKVGSRDDYVDKWLEALCRCTNLPAPQYVPPIKPEKPGPRYL